MATSFFGGAFFDGEFFFSAGPPVTVELGARLPVYYIHRIKRVREVVKELPAVVAILRELDEPGPPALAEAIGRLTAELQPQGVEWREAYTELLRREREEAEQFARMQWDDMLAVLVMLELLR